jgi:hypothetical protein
MEQSNKEALVGATVALVDAFGLAIDTVFNAEYKEDGDVKIQTNPHAAITSMDEQGQIVMDACALIMAQLIATSSHTVKKEQQERIDKITFDMVLKRLESHVAGYRLQLEREKENAKV